jgi:hypothetical protein
MVNFIRVQQWLASHLGLELQLLAGTYVLVPAHDIPLLGETRGLTSHCVHGSGSCRQPRQQRQLHTRCSS